MKCYFCKNEFPDDELAEVEITLQDEQGKTIGTTKKLNVCEMCCLVKLMGVDEESAHEALEG